MKKFITRIPRWVRPLLGIFLVILGSVLALHAATSIELFVLLIGGGLVFAGGARIVDAFTPTSAADDAWPWIAYVSGFLLVGAGIATLLWRESTLPMLALAVSLTLLVSGAVSLMAVFRRGSKHRARAAIGSLAALLTGGLVILWPKLSLWAFGVFLGGWLLFVGLRLILEFLARDASPNSKRRARGLRGFAQFTASSLALLLAIIMVLMTSWLHAGDPRLVPDAFYTPPSDLPSAPGTLLRAEPLMDGIPENANAWRILYTTTNPDDSPAVASGTVVAPRHHGSAALPVVSIAHGTKGITPRCAPSLSATPLSDGPAAALRELVSAGWVGVTSDYVGLGTAGPHPYLIGAAEGRNVLDAYRAAHQLREGFTLRDDTVIWGHSQGGHGALFSAAIAKSYAPEISVLGVAALAPATNLVDLALGVKDAAAGKVVSSYIAAAWNDVYPELDVASMITPGYARTVQRIGERCFDGRDALSGIIAGTQLFDAVIPEAALNGPLGDKLRENSVTADIDYPLFVAQGLADQLVLPTMQEQWVAQRCAAGQAMEYREYPGLDHLPLVADDSPLINDLLAWAQDRLANKSPINTCP
ncbi:lipase family protein [Paeniglutamicibacter terrestris]|uniref:Lipase n=1 Tax=Paeniglutamicibacter terrestris TaxID=2723403 RepID=A0ABX1G569_9MICC|nr:lipase family protein [Paeniglutamicibacter terrestris]NKG21169.1 lipase [Paeniglutamicibacter terrestris]